MRQINSNGKFNNHHRENEGLRTFLKTKIPTSIWPILRFFDKYLIYLMYCGYLIRRKRKERFYPPLPFACQQSVFSFESNCFSKQPESEMLSNIFHNSGFHFFEGQHSIYLYRESDIKKINPLLAEFYPYPIGLKIIKGTELSSDQTPYYTSFKLAPDTTRVGMRAVGSMKEKAFISNLLNLNGVAPRVYDIIKLNFGWQSYFAFVVQPIQGEIVTGKEGSAFVSKLRRVLEEKGIEVLGHKEHCDFQPPEFRNNIIADETGVYYVDVQNFVMFSNAYQKKLANALQKKSIKRPMSDRDGHVALLAQPNSRKLSNENLKIYFSELNEFFEQYNVNLKNNTLLDIGCNWGFFIMFALSRNARWCVGLDTDAMIDTTRQLLYEKGFMRFDLLAWNTAKLNDGSYLPFIKYDIIHIAHHIGEVKLSKCLEKINFKTLLYEGYPHESVQDLKIKIERQAFKVDIIGHCRLKFGKVESNPVLLAQFKRR
jgi:hypothetical protein